MTEDQVPVEVVDVTQASVGTLINIVIIMEVAVAMEELEELVVEEMDIIMIMDLVCG